MLVLHLILVCVVLFVLKFLPEIRKFHRIFRFSKTLPGPGVKEFLKNAKEDRLLNWMSSLIPRYGTTFKLWMGKDLVLFCSDPDDVKTILSSNQLLYKSPGYKMMEKWLGRGLLTNGGLDWHKRRKMLTPGFHFKTLAEFKPQMEENCKIFIDKLNKVADGREFDIYPYITLFALDIICETAMGIQRNAQIHSDSQYVKAVVDMCRITRQRSFSFFGRFPIVFDNSQAGRECDAALEILHGETRRTIELRRKVLEECNYNINVVDDDIGTKRRLAFLDTLLLAQKEGADLSDTDIREEVDTFMFEGHDTTSSAIAFAIYLLSLYPEEQEKAFQEAVMLEGMEKESMKYIEAVIKETLRLYPSVPMYGRQLQEDFDLNGLKVPRGTTIFVFSYMVHRNEKHFPDPYRFDPERFLDGEKNMHPYAFSAFSAGPRNCIGQKFAMLELKCALSTLLRNFKILPKPGFKPDLQPDLVLKSGNGVQVRLEKRNPLDFKF